MSLTRRLAAIAAAVLLAMPAVSAARQCPNDSVQVGDVCVDKYEASVWTTTDASTIRKIKRGTVASALDLAAATQHGVASDDYASCDDMGRGCLGYYAVSIAGVTPSRNITQLQAIAACRNAGKHLTTNSEWQAAALGTPDSGPDNGTTDCNTTSTTQELPEDPVNTGSRSSCVSDTGAFDMVGNLEEWMADWLPAGTACPSWSSFSDDAMCLSGATTMAVGPGVLKRGGHYFFGVNSGPYAVTSHAIPQQQGDGEYGFRCARRL
jgi:hypothetical protein